MLNGKELRSLGPSAGRSALTDVLLSKLNVADRGSKEEKKYGALIEGITSGGRGAKEAAFFDAVRLIESLEKPKPVPQPQEVSSPTDQFSIGRQQAELEKKYIGKPLGTAGETKEEPEPEPEEIVLDVTPAEFEQAALSRKHSIEELDNMEARVDWSK